MILLYKYGYRKSNFIDLEFIYFLNSKKCELLEKLKFIKFYYI